MTACKKAVYLTTTTLKRKTACTHH